MSRIYYEGLKLKDLVELSDHILIVTNSNPASEIKKIKSGIFNKAPEFEYEVNNYIVEEVIFSKYALPKVISVFPYNITTNINLHSKFHKEGVRKSTYEYNYKTRTKFTTDKKIIFLRKGKYLEFACSGSFENVSKEEEIRKIIKEIKKK